MNLRDTGQGFVRALMRRSLTLALIALIWTGAALMSGGPVVADTVDRIAVRTGEHTGFSRMVFDWPRDVGYDLTVDGADVRLAFDAPGRVNRQTIAASLPDRVSRVEVVADDPLTISMTMIEGASLSHFRVDNSVVIDVADPIMGDLVAGTAVPDAADAENDAVQIDEPTVSAAPVSVVADEPADEPADKTGDETADLSRAGPSLSGESAKLVRSARLDLQYSGTPVALRSEPVFNGVRLTYPLAEPLPAAVFQRAGFIWVIFEGYRPVDHAGLRSVAGDRILDTEQIPDPNATILRYRVSPSQYVMAHRRDAAWIIEIKDSRTAPRIPLEIGQHQYNGGPAVFLPVSDVGSRVDIVDPEVGDNITVVPVLPAGRGVSEVRRFAEFNVARSAQGVAVEILADGVRVERFRNGVAISTAGGLALSVDRHAPVFAERAEDTRDDPQRMIDFAAWRAGGADNYDRRRQELLHRLSLAPEAERGGVRWDLARFYLGHGMPDRTIGILQVMADDDPDLLDNAEFRAVRGVAHARLRRFDKARADLSHSALDSESDIHLWRSVAAAGTERYAEAIDHYQRGSGLLSTYDERERALFEMTALEAAFKLGDADMMEQELAVLDSLLLSPRDSAEVEYYRARLHLMEGRNEEAMASLERVEAAGQRPSADWAVFARIEHEIEQDTIPASDAIDVLERLRFAWRGDTFELDILERLGSLYMDTGEYRIGFNVLRQAVTHFPDSPRSRDISMQMSAAFEHLFLDGVADGMPPIEALALYYDFRELTPLGASGDKMIRRLSDRLVSVDLLERAADLLEHQIRYRLEGVAQAQVAGRLAMIYLLDRKPDRALDVLRATRQTLIPADIEKRRRYLEVRSLIDLERYEEAEVMLEGDRGDEARLLLADLYWGAGQWSRVVENSESVMERRWEDDTPLSNDERRQVLRMAVAQSLDDNPAGLQSLRERYGALMDDGAYSAAFEVITARNDPDESQIRELTESIASVNRLEGFMDSYRDEFSGS